MNEGCCIIEVLFDATQKPHDWNFVAANPAFEKQIGLNDLIGKTIRELIPDINPEWLRICERIMHTHEPERLEHYSTRLNCWWDIYAFPAGERNDSRIAVLLIDTTDYKRAQAAQAELAAIVNSSDDPIISKDLNGTIQTWNAAAERLFGYTADEAIGQSIMLIVPANRVAEEEDILRRLQRGERIESYETVRRCKNGTLLDVSLTISPIPDRTGRITGASKIVRDISERRNDERLREQQTGLLELIASGAPLEQCLNQLCLAVPRISSGVRASILMTNAERTSFQRAIAPELQGFWGESLAGTPINDLMIGTCGEAVFRGEAVLCEDVATDERWSAEWRELCKNNGVLAGYSVPICNEHDEPIASFMLCFDKPRRPSARERELAGFGCRIASIALARNRTNATLRESEARQKSQKAAFRAAVNGAPLEESLDILLRGAVARLRGNPRAAFYIADDDGAYLHPVVTKSSMNETCTAQVEGFEVGPNSLSCGLAAYTGQPILTANVFEDSKWEHMRPLAREFNFCGCWSFPIHTAAGHAVGTFAIYQRQPLEASRHDMAVAEAVTQAAAIIISRHREVEKRRRTQQELTEAHRRKDEFLATLAHELRNPLAPLRNGLSIMRQNDPKTMDKAHDLMARQLTQLTHLVDDLLDVSRITRGKIELRLSQTDLSAVIQDAIETTRPQMDAAGHSLRVELPAEAVMMQADRERLTQVFTNLITNAIKYTPAHGRIEVLVEQRNRFAVAVVRDNGMGIDPGQLGNIFDMFAQAGQLEGRANEGLGIGLTLVRQVVELHDGTVTASSPSPGTGQGTEFTVRLPLAVAERMKENAAVPSVTATGRLRLMIVDDNHDVADSMMLLLSSMGHEVHVAYNGQQALAEAPAFQADAIFLDIGLPDINGLETARRLRNMKESRNVTLIALTGWGQSTDRDRSAEAGFDHHLVKPVGPEILERLLGEIKPRGTAD